MMMQSIITLWEKWQFAKNIVFRLRVQFYSGCSLLEWSGRHIYWRCVIVYVCMCWPCGRLASWRCPPRLSADLCWNDLRPSATLHTMHTDYRRTGDGVRFTQLLESKRNRVTHPSATCFKRWAPHLPPVFSVTVSSSLHHICCICFYRHGCNFYW